MAVLKSEDGKDLLVDCECGCDEGMRLRIDPEDPIGYCFVSYTNSEFYRAQGDNFWDIFCKKLRKILAIIMNQDYYYSEITMSKEDFERFKEYINKF